LESRRKSSLRKNTKKKRTTGRLKRYFPEKKACRDSPRGGRRAKKCFEREERSEAPREEATEKNLDRKKLRVAEGAKRDVKEGWEHSEDRAVKTEASSLVRGKGSASLT